MTDRTRVSHLLRRLTFGPTATEVDEAERTGADATLTRVLAPIGRTVGLPGLEAAAKPPEGASREERQKARQQARAQLMTATRWWLSRMVTEPGAAEKLTFFWHGHWATSSQKVRSAPLMLAQQQTFRRYGGGPAGPLVRAMVRDPALILWLDGQKNTRKAPNENLARELMELFTLGVGNYGEADVKAGARVLTGWQVDRAAGTAKLLPRRHDTTEVTLLGSTGRFDVDSYADLLVRHPAHAPFLAQRLWVRYGSDTGPAPQGVAAAAPDGTTAMLRALATDPAFAATAGQLVKQPIEWVIGAVRQLGVEDVPLAALKALGQVPFRPPSVGGWPVGPAWLTTSSTQARLKHGQALTAKAPAAVETLADVAQGDRVEALARLLVVDTWTNRTNTVLQDAAREPRRLLALGLASPEYAVH
ncbi:DUF1800 domain-containing protein [Actinoplanes friuliensis]|uniref:DUF1800 domain-containing protein n=1 Tax=Actinoplanes friuliensis DSM 7358 TaxID=1246995 RepID=U5W330_9ACTN|nr:DUF1800 domain-containing protein [Actinoplanes friuliensis]AGZ42400.1 hypothetical protein AFR_20640 [Actinoplanes friuliensis DSM 7358]